MSSNNTDFFSLNLETMLRHYPGFQKDVIEKYTASGELETVDTASGAPTAKIDGLWLHSSRNPVREADKLIAGGLSRSSGICLVYGFGLGYHIEAAMRKYPDLDIIIIEPDPGLFLAALGARDYRKIISSDRTGFLFDTGAGAVASLLSAYGNPVIQSIRLKPLYERSIDYYSEVDSKVKAFISKNETNRNTLRRFGESWVKNLFSNIEMFSRASDAGIWYDRFRGLPGIVIAAGPSLDDILPHIGELKEKYVIFCVDTALRSLIEAGIAPDFIIVVDPQYLNTRHLDNCLDSPLLEGRTALISESSTHPAVFRRARLPVYFFRSVFPLGKLFEKHAGIVSPLGAGGSVSTTAWDFARKVGCSEICTAGLDLGFPLGQTHCRRSLSPLVAHLRSSRLRPVETINNASVRNASPFEHPDNSGGTTLSDKRLIIYKWWFEEQIASGKGGPSASAKLYNCSQHGIKIEGMELITIEEMLAHPSARSEIDLLKAQTPENPADHSAAAVRAEIKKTVQTIADECSRLEEICEEASDILDVLESAAGAADRTGLYSRLSELDNMISATRVKELSAFIIQPALNEILEQEPENDIDALENSRNLYTSIGTACSFHREQALKALSRLKES